MKQALRPLACLWATSEDLEDTLATVLCFVKIHKSKFLTTICYGYLVICWQTVSLSLSQKKEGD